MTAPNPTDTIIALEKALEAGPTMEWKDAREPNGHGMGWSAGPNAWLGTDSYSKETAASAALIAACSPLAIRTLLDAHANALRDAERLRKALVAVMEGSRFEDGHWGSIRTPNNAAMELARAALDDNTKGAMSHG